MKGNSVEKAWLKRVTEGRSSSEKGERKDVAPEIVNENKPESKNSHNNTELGGFKDVAGMDSLKKLITEGFINVLQNKDCAKVFGICPPNLLFYGPAGCGKTFFAQKVAEELGINFMEVVPDDLASQFIHGTQQKIGELFCKAESNAPTLMFFDEFDAMVHTRSNDEQNKSFSDETNEFLCKLNNSADKGIYVIVATNHPERIDKAILRAGRIDEMIYVDMPDNETRKSLFRLALSKIPASSDIDYDRLADLTKGYNCSDISYIVKAASRKMFNESIKDKDQPYKQVSQLVLEDAISRKSPSVSSKDLQEYERLHREYSPKDKQKQATQFGFNICNI